jgi:hypothetical protein
MVFAGYVATPLFLSGIVALYPLVWLCALVGTIALFYTGYLLYLGIPTFLSINKEEGLSFASSTLAIGVLVLEVLLAITVVLWGWLPTLLIGRQYALPANMILCRQCSISSRFLLGTGPSARYDGVCQRSCPLNLAAYVHNVQKYFSECHDAEISSFFAQPDLAAGCAFCAPGVSKTPTAVTASQPDIASGSAMIVDLATKKSSMPASRIWCARWRRSPR